jgi:hypothetical protein
LQSLTKLTRRDQLTLLTVVFGLSLLQPLNANGSMASTSSASGQPVDLRRGDTGYLLRNGLTATVDEYLAAAQGGVVTVPSGSRGVTAA